MLSQSCNSNACSVFPVRDYSSIEKSSFYVSTSDDYNVPTENDYEEFSRGVNILQDLTDNGVISEEEENRRKILLEEYLKYQRGDNALARLSPSLFCSYLFKHFRRLWDCCIGLAYYTDTDD